RRDEGRAVEAVRAPGRRPRARRPGDDERGGARRGGRDPDAGRKDLVEDPGGRAGRQDAAREGPRRAEAEGRRPRRPARARARDGPQQADEEGARGAGGLPGSDSRQSARKAVLVSGNVDTHALRRQLAGASATLVGVVAAEALG